MLKDTLPFYQTLLLYPAQRHERQHTIHHNIPFLSDIITRSIPKVIKDNIMILSVLINENSPRLASAFFSIGSAPE